MFYELYDKYIQNRKLEHIDIVLNRDTSFPDQCRELYDKIILIHQAFPKISFEDIDTSIDFLGYRLKAPLMITGMTGGHPYTREINGKLAEIASKYRIALGVGSQRPLIVHRGNNEVLESYRVVREVAKDIPLIGNIGINTINELTVNDIEYLVKTIDADALAIHLNPAQEAIQPEGDTRFNQVLLEKVEEIMDSIDIPVIIKEVGNGLSIETVSLFTNIGVKYFDIAGACGTNWVLVEKYRERTSILKKRIADKLESWGIPTPLSLIETRYSAPKSFIIASGGVWDGVKAVKNLVLGADMVGLAKPVIELLIKKGLEEAMKYLDEYIETMKTVMFLTGMRNIKEAKEKPVVLLEPIPTYLLQRGIDLKQYITYIRRGG